MIERITRDLGGTYALLQAKFEIIGGQRLLCALQLEPSLLEHVQDAAFKRLNKVILVTKNEVGVCQTLDLDVDAGRWTGSSQSVHFFVRLYN